MSLLLIIDNLTTLMPKLTDVLSGLGAKYEIKRYDANMNIADYCGVILTGRSIGSREINRANSALLKKVEDVPVLGVCYGAEIIATSFGGALRKRDQLFEGWREIIMKKKNRLTLDATSLRVYESHMLEVSKLPESFESLGYSSHNSSEVFKHRDKEIYGVQFHPESSGEDGVFILKNFLDFTGCLQC